MLRPAFKNPGCSILPNSICAAINLHSYKPFKQDKEDMQVIVRKV